MDRKPSLFKILFTDAIAFISILFVVVSWLLYLYLFVLQGQDASISSLPVIFGLITLLAIMLITWRVSAINSIFARGVEINATISRVFFYRNRGRVDCVYFYLGEQFSSTCRVMKNRDTRELEPGMGVVVLVDPDHPDRALIRDLFLGD